MARAVKKKISTSSAQATHSYPHLKLHLAQDWQQKYRKQKRGRIGNLNHFIYISFSQKIAQLRVRVDERVLHRTLNKKMSRNVS